MKTVVVALTGILFAVSPALAGEGNGPDYPGLQQPNIGVSSSGSTVIQMSSRSDSGFEPRSSFPTPVTPDGVLTAQNFPQRRAAPSQTAMNGNMTRPN